MTRHGLGIFFFRAGAWVLIGRFWVVILVGCTATIGLCLLPARPVTAAGWPDQRRVGPLLCHADFSLAPYDALLHELAGLQRELSHILALPPSQEPILLFFFDQRETYRQYLQHYFPGAPDRPALFIKGSGPGMVFAYRGSDFAIDVRHETTHAILHAALPMVPLWLDEGLAEYFEVPPEQRAYDHPHLTSARWQIRLGRRPSMEALEQLGQVADMGRAEYRDAWCWVHFLLHSSADTHDELRRYLADIRMHRPPGQLSHRLRGRVNDVDDQLVDHFRRWRQ